MTAVEEGRIAPSTSVRIRGNPWWTLVTVALGIVMVGLDGTVVAIANPYIGRSLHASLSDLQWITNAYLLVLAVLLVVGGRLGDRYGRRRIFLTGVVGFALASVGVGLADSITGVIVLRGVQGAFGALLLPNTLALMRVAFPDDKLNSAIGIWTSTSALATAGAPIVGGLLVEHVSWQSVFYLNVPVAIITCAVGALALSESRESVRERVDSTGVVTLSISLFAIVFGIVKAQSWGWGNPSTLGFLGGGLAMMAVFVWVELRATAPLVPPRLFRIRSVSLGCATVILSFFALFAVLFFVSLFLQNVQGLSAVATGTRTLALTLAFALTSIRAARITTRLGPGPTITIGLLLVAGALLGMTLLEPNSGYLVLFPRSPASVSVSVLWSWRPPRPSSGACRSTTPVWRVGCRRRPHSWAGYWGHRCSARWWRPGRPACCRPTRSGRGRTRHDPPRRWPTQRSWVRVSRRARRRRLPRPATRRSSRGFTWRC